MTDTSAHNAKRYAAANMLTHLAVVGATALIGLWLTSYLIGELTVEVYSIVPLAVSIGSYLSIVTMLVTRSSSRYVAIHFHKGESERSNVYFNSSFFGLLYITVGLVVAAAVISVWGIRLLNIPGGYQQAASGLFFMVLLSVLLSAVASPLAVSTFITHRLYMTNLAKVGSRIVQVILLIGLFHFLGTRLAWVGVSYLGLAVFLLIANFVLVRYLTPELKLDPSKCRLQEAREVCGMGAWLVVDRVGTLLYLNTDLIVINLVLGATDCGRYAPVLQLVTLLRLITPAMSSVLSPVTIEKIAQDKMDELVSITTRGIRLLGLGLAIPIGVIAGLSQPLLRVWLGPEFEGLSGLLVIMTLAHVVFLPLNPIYNILRGLNKVRFPAMVTATGGVLNIILSVVLAWYAGLGILGVGLATVICFGVRTTLVLSRYTARHMALSPFALVRPIWAGALLAILVTAGGMMISRSVAIDGYLALGVTAIVLGGAGLALMQGLFLRPDERRLMLELAHLSKGSRGDA